MTLLRRRGIGAMRITAEPAPAGDPVATSGYSSDGPSVDVAAPAGIVSGELLVAFVVARDWDDSLTTTGWTRLQTATSPATGRPAVTLFGKVAGSSEPATYTLGTGGSTNNSERWGFVIRIPGNSGATGDVATDRVLPSSEILSTIDIPSITPATAGVSYYFAAITWPQSDKTDLSIPAAAEVLAAEDYVGTGFAAVTVEELSNNDPTGTRTFSLTSGTTGRVAAIGCTVPS